MMINKTEKGVGAEHQCLDLVYVICESELSHLPYSNYKRTTILSCYTFQREKELLS